MPDAGRPVPLAPGSTIGILGSGQLGRMLAMAAARLGLKTHIYCEESGPAFDVASRTTKAAFDDATALDAFARCVGAVTYEFENVPLWTARHLATRVPVHPGARALEVAQDRLAEKEFIAGLGIPVAPFCAVDSSAELTAAAARFGAPGYPQDPPARIRRQGSSRRAAGGRCDGGLECGRWQALGAGEAYRVRLRDLGACRARSGWRACRLRLSPQHARGRHPAPVGRARRTA